jgi:gliding motility-associated lipoprotein GldH
MKLFRLFLVLVVPCALCLGSCTTVDLYEKNETIPGFKWKSSFQPEFDFTIKDSTSRYRLLLVLRHNDKYNYTNIWVNIYSQPPNDTVHKIPFDATLATNEGWLTRAAMDDIYEHRIPVTGYIYFKPGHYHFKLEQIMREDPLENVLSVGLRMEKTNM